MGQPPSLLSPLTIEVCTTRQLSTALDSSRQLSTALDSSRPSATPAIDHAHQHPSAPASPPSIEMHCVYQPATFPPHSPSHRTSWSTCRVHNRSSSGSIRQHSAALHASKDTLSACPPILTLHARLTPSPWVVPRPGVPRGVQRSRQVRRWPARVSRRPAAAVPTCCGVAERRWGCQRRLRVREAGRGAPAAALALRVSTQ